LNGVDLADHGLFDNARHELEEEAVAAGSHVAVASRDAEACSLEHAQAAQRSTPVRVHSKRE
jgi:hypothetical protein